MLFNDTKTLIVVYKDELLANQIRKLVETNDDVDEANPKGTRDKSLKIVTWTEEYWLTQKTQGNIDSKILYIGDIKGIDKLVPVLDIKFNESGVYYGWAGMQAAIFVKPKEIKDRESYQNFLSKLENLPIPELIKNKNKIETPHTDESEGETEEKGLLARIKNSFEKASEDLSVWAKDMFKDKKMMEKQMLFYGIIMLYNNDLDNFINA